MPNNSRRRRERVWRNRYRRLRAQLSDPNALRAAHPHTVERIEDEAVADVKQIRIESGFYAKVANRMINYADTAKGRFFILVRGSEPLKVAGHDSSTEA